MTILARMVIAGFAAASQFGCATVCVAAVREVTLSVTVQQHDGAPLPDAPAEAVNDLDGGLVFTDAQGRAEFHIDADDGEEIIVALGDGQWFNLSAAEKSHAADRFKHFQSAYHFERSLTVTVQPGVNSYTATLVGHPAVNVRMAIDDGSGVLKGVAVGVLGGLWSGLISPPEPVIVKGVRKGVPAEICVQIATREAAPQAFVLPLTAQQTASDIDLGIVPLSVAARSIPAPMTLTNVTHVFTPGGYALFDDVTLIRADGQVILGFRVHPEGGPEGGRVLDRFVLPLTDPLLPPGEFYISPGVFGGIVPRHLLACLRNGRQGDLDAAGVPKVVAVEGQATAPLVIDGLAARDAILSVQP